MTPTPNDRWLGLTRWTVIAPPSRRRGPSTENETCGKKLRLDIVTLLRGCSLAAGNSEAEATSRWRGTSLAGNVVYRTFSAAAAVAA